MSNNRSPRPFRPIACGAAIALMLGTSAIAENHLSPDQLVQVNFVEDAGGSQRIDNAGKLRMLSQRIPAAACNLNAGIAPEQSKALLDGAIAEFDKILAALTFGDETLGIYGAEDRRRTTRVIEELQKKFAPMHAALDDSVEGVPQDAAIQVIADHNMEVLEMAKLLVVEVSGEYANPVALLQSDVIAIDIAGRQRMLTQKASKEICFILSGVNASASQEVLGSTVNTFEVSLNALRNGMPEVGMQPAPNDEIAQGLDQVKEDWNMIKGHVDAVMAGDTLSPEDRAAVFIGLNKTMADMNSVVGLYSDASKLGL